MQRKHNSLLTSNAKIFRKNMTEQEKHLWYDFLRTYPIRILRQKVIADFIVDFYCAKAQLIVEIDGSQHYMDNGLINDQKRTKVLNDYGFKVIRFSNLDVEQDFEAVCLMIDDEIRKRIPG